MLLGSYTFCHLLLSAWSAFPPSSLAEHLLILRNSLSFHHFFTQLSHIFALHPSLRMLPLEVFIVTVHRVQCPVLVLTFSILPSIWSSHPPSAVLTIHMAEETGPPWSLATLALWSQLRDCPKLGQSQLLILLVLIHSFKINYFTQSRLFRVIP